jgi:hypothetical protein
MNQDQDDRLTLYSVVVSYETDTIHMLELKIPRELLHVREYVTEKGVETFYGVPEFRAKRDWTTNPLQTLESAIDYHHGEATKDPHAISQRVLRDETRHADLHRSIEARLHQMRYSPEKAVSQTSESETPKKDSTT